MLKIYNTLTKQLEEFKPISDKSVSFYHCGPTVYWTQHIGNLRAVVMADVVTRTLEYLDYHVKLVRNYTDVGHLSGDNEGDADSGEDRMAKGAKREGLSPEEIAQKYTDVYEQDVAALNIREADVKPTATGHIQEMIDMVQVLLDKDFAYSTDLAVYFDISKAKDYTRLSGQNIEENISGAGTGDTSDSQKKHPSDFALWFFKAGVHEQALQTWKSPFESPLVENGEGFPGWHIECSAMARKHLGDTIDIHMGGIEHIPVHHTNEIAQSESANGVEFTHYWLHNEHLTVDGGKMAKSEGTGYALSEVVERGFDPLALRYLYLGAHYRSKQNFTWEALEGAQTALHKLYDAVRSWERDAEGLVISKFQEQFTEKLADDFNTPQALAVMWDLVKSDFDPAEKRATLLEFDRVLGLKLDDVKQETIEVPADVQELLDKRQQARDDKDFDLSDQLRDQITEKGFAVEDTSDGQQMKQL